MINKKAQIGGIIYNNAIYLLLALMFTAGVFLFVWQQSNGAAIWEQYYVSEITREINSASPGDVVKIDVQKATEIAKRNRADFNEIFRFVNSQNELCVKLSLGRDTCINYYNNVDIVNDELMLGVPGNVLYFEVRGKAR